MSGTSNSLPESSNRSEPLLASLADEGPQPRRRSPLVNLAVVLFMVLLVVGPVAYLAIPREAAKWRLATAIEQRQAGDREAADRTLSAAIDKFPDDVLLYRQRAQWRLDDKQFETALADADRAIELAPVSGTYILRSQILQHLGRHSEAIADWEQIGEYSSESDWRSMYLNGLAYARAVGRLELDQAWEEINEALELSPASSQGTANAALLDTRGFIAYLRDDLEAATADMDLAVELIEKEHAAAFLDRDGPLVTVDLQRYEARRRQHAQSVAVIRYHRALVRDMLGETEGAEKDRGRVRDLGFEPNEDLF